MDYSTWIQLIFGETFKTTAKLKRNMGFTRNYTQLFRLPKERFGQVSKIPKIAPKLTKTHGL